MKANPAPLFNLVPGKTFLHRLTGKTKVRSFLILLVYIIMSFDLRLLLPLLIAGVMGLKSLNPNWKILRYFFAAVIAMNALNIFLFWLADPSVGSYWCGGGSTVLVRFTGTYYISAETLWYLSVRLVKMITSFIVSVVFILSITPSELAAGLYSIKVPYKVCTVFSLAFRYIPDIGRDFQDIRNSMQTRGVEMDPKKAGLISRLKQYALILVPLIISSFERVGNISNAMDLRGYGKLKTRTYYGEREETQTDKAFKIIHCCLLVFCAYWIITQNIMPHDAKIWYPFR